MNVFIKVLFLVVTLSTCKVEPKENAKIKVDQNLKELSLNQQLFNNVFYNYIDGVNQRNVDQILLTQYPIYIDRFSRDSLKQLFFDNYSTLRYEKFLNKSKITDLKLIYSDDKVNYYKLFFYTNFLIYSKFPLSDTAMYSRYTKRVESDMPFLKDVYFSEKDSCAIGDFNGFFMALQDRSDSSNIKFIEAYYPYEYKLKGLLPEEFIHNFLK